MFYNVTCTNLNSKADFPYLPKFDFANKHTQMTTEDSEGIKDVGTSSLP